VAEGRVGRPAQPGQRSLQPATSSPTCAGTQGKPPRSTAQATGTEAQPRWRRQTVIVRDAISWSSRWVARTVRSRNRSPIRIPCGTSDRHPPCPPARFARALAGPRPSATGTSHRPRGVARLAEGLV